MTVLESLTLFTIPVSFQKENIGDLLIVNAQLSHAGMYTCTAQTVVDSALASAKLVVRGKIGRLLHYCTDRIVRRDPSVNIKQSQEAVSFLGPGLHVACDKLLQIFYE